MYRAWPSVCPRPKALSMLVIIMLLLLINYQGLCQVVFLAFVIESGRARVQSDTEGTMIDSSIRGNRNRILPVTSQSILTARRETV